MVMTITGDIKGIETLAGHAGASATYNCVLCDARLHETYKAGVPHLRVLPDRWASEDQRPPEAINPPPRSGTTEMAEFARCYAEACAAPNAPKTLSSGELRFKSCIHTPLFRSDDLLGHTGMTPLHVSLGKGTGYLKAVEARCTELDSGWARVHKQGSSLEFCYPWFSSLFLLMSSEFLTLWSSCHGSSSSR